MLAAVMTAYGGPEVLAPHEVAAPTVAGGLVRVDLHAAALNWHDVLVRQGLYNSPLPHVPGADGAGVRADTGEQVVVVPSLWWGPRQQAPAPGWEILGDVRWGTLAESVLVPPDCLLPRPAGWSWAESAALPLVGVTVHRALVDRGRLRAGERLLVLGAGGGVATMAVALGVALGAQVWVTSSSQERIARAVESGARGGVDYRDADWPEHARAITDQAAGYDLILDSVGSWGEAIRALRPGGRLVTIGASRDNEQHLLARPFYFGQYDLLGSTMGRVADLRAVLDLVEAGRLGPPAIGATYALDEARQAHERIEAGDVLGKIAIRIR